MENGKMECTGKDRGSRYRTARKYLLEGNSAMDQQRYSEVMAHHLFPVSVQLLNTCSLAHLFASFIHLLMFPDLCVFCHAFCAAHIG